MAIAGIVQFGAPQPLERDLARMARALAPYRRGLAAATWTDGRAGLLEMSTEMDAGPPWSPRPAGEGRAAVIADARVDNRDELAGPLGLSPSRARSIEAGDIVRRGFALWGLRLTRHIVGAFAILVWDPRSGTLHCLRDHAGQKPLFFHRGADFVAVATMPSALIALEGLGCRLDELKMAEMLLGCHERTGATPFSGIRRIPAGTRLEADARGDRTTRYWNVAESPRVRLASDEAYAEEARALLLASTDAHLRSDVPTGVSLSGGLDSSAAACVAATLLRSREGRIAAFHRTPPGDFQRLGPRSKLLHERRFVEEIARQHTNVDVHYVGTGAPSPLCGLAERMQYCQRPVLRVANHHWFHSLWREATRRGVGVLLVGGAGDLTLSWGGRGELAEMARRGRLATTIRLSGARARWLGASRARVLHSQVVSPLLAELRFRLSAPFVPGRNVRHAMTWSPINPGLVHELDMARRLSELGWDTSAPRLLQQRALRVRQANAYDDAIGEIHTGLGAMYGFDYRDPFRDKRVLEFSFGIPAEQYLAGGADRSLLRRAMVGIVPGSILERRKKGAQAVDWAERLLEARDELREEIAAISRSSLASRMLDVPRMASILESDHLPRWVEGRVGATDHEASEVYRSFMRDYSSVLLTGVSVGMFLRWVESGCPPPDARGGVR
jgi:asparagine synthase (glutamine-hydrolysing)